MAIRYHRKPIRSKAAVSAVDGEPRSAVVESEFVAPEYQAIEQREARLLEVLTEVHASAMRVPLQTMVQELKEALSTQLVTFMTGQSSRTVQRWASGEIQDIREESKRRLVTAYEILQLINRFEAPGVAATWFIGQEPQLDFDMPIEAIQRGELEDALAAARTFVAVG